MSVMSDCKWVEAECLRRTASAHRGITVDALMSSVNLITAGWMTLDSTTPRGLAIGAASSFMVASAI